MVSVLTNSGQLSPKMPVAELPHYGGRILYLGVVGKEKSPTVATMRLFVRVNFTSIRW